MSSLMKVSTSARMTSRTSFLYDLIAVKAFMFTTISEILAMYFAMTRFTDGHAIIDFKTFIWKFRPFLDVMRVYLSLVSTLLTSIVVSLIDSMTPLLQLWRQSSTVSFKRFTILPVICLLSSLRLSGACTRAINSIMVARSKHLFAIRTFFRDRWIAMRPAILRTVARSISTKMPLFIFLTTHFTDKSNHILNLLKTSAICALHYTIYCDLCQPSYCDLAIQRWQEMTGQRAVQS